MDGAYLRKTLALSYMPWRYVKGPAPGMLKRELKVLFGGETVLFASGREALLALLRSMEIRPGEEVIVQGYTCVVVPNAIHAAGGTVKYADIDQSNLNMTADTVRALITPRTRAVICQHTFGIPADTRALRQLCDEHHLLLIEDMAHVLPDAKGPAIGIDGDFLLLSFGRDKAVSGISGGAVICRGREIEKLREIERNAPSVGFLEVLKLLEYPTRMRSIIRPLSGTFLRKPAVKLLNMLGFLAPVLTREERRGFMSPVVRKMPNACAALALHSLRKLKQINDWRRTLTSFYLRHGKDHNWPMLTHVVSGLPLQKFPLFVTGAEAMRKKLQKENIWLDDGWTGCVVCPSNVVLPDAGYEWGMDPEAEAACMQILSLPTHPTMTMYQAEILARRIDTLINHAH